MQDKDLVEIFHDYLPSEVFQAFLDYLECCRNDVQQAQEVVSQEDAKRQDFLHAIEFEENCKRRSKIATQEHLSRKRRRISKDTILKYEKIVAFSNSERNKPALKAIRGLIKEQKTVEEYLSSERTYKPRGTGKEKTEQSNIEVGTDGGGGDIT